MALDDQFIDYEGSGETAVFSEVPQIVQLGWEGRLRRCRPETCAFLCIFDLLHVPYRNGPLLEPL